MTLPKIDLPLKPTYLKITDQVNFFHLFSLIEEKYQNCFLMESLGESSSERYSVIGFDPESIFWARGKTLFWKNKNNSKIEQIQTDNPYYELAKNFSTTILSRKYSGGLVGYLGYEAANYFDEAINLEEHSDFPNFKMGLFLDGLVYDKMTAETFYFFYKNDRQKQVLELIEQSQEVNFIKNYKRKKIEVKFLNDSLDFENYKKIVKNTLEEIKAGNTFQAEVGFRSDYQISGDSILIYEKLREFNPSPFMFFAKFGDEKLIGASPEMLFRLNKNMMQSSPLAGTIGRGKTEIEDIALARELLNDKKEIAEHNMLVDMHRNDMAKVARFGTVRVANLMEIKKFSTVQHISSDIVGIIDSGETMFSALASNFPMGTLCGAPKVESMKIIAKNEKQARGPYGGGFGNFGLNGDCNFCGILRSLYIKKEKGYVQTSAGIVYDSKPEKEFQEVQSKLAAMKSVLESFEEGFESW